MTIFTKPPVFLAFLTCYVDKERREGANATSTRPHCTFYIDRRCVSSNPFHSVPLHLGNKRWRKGPMCFIQSKICKATKREIGASTRGQFA